MVKLSGLLLVSVILVCIFCGRVQLTVKLVVLPETVGFELLQSVSGICGSLPRLVGSFAMSGVMQMVCFIGTPDMENSHRPGRICWASAAVETSVADSRTRVRANDMRTPH